jgi:hypothetical protein
MKGLKRLEQPFQSPTVADFAALASHPTLEDLQLNYVDDQGLAELSRLPALKFLHLNQPQCKAKGLEQLAKASKLERLALMNGGVLKEYGPAEVAALEKLTQLKNLSVFGVPFDQAAIQQIRQSLSKQTQIQIGR